METLNPLCFRKNNIALLLSLILSGKTATTGARYLFDCVYTGRHFDWQFKVETALFRRSFRPRYGLLVVRYKEEMLKILACHCLHTSFQNKQQVVFFLSVPYSSSSSNKISK